MYICIPICMCTYVGMSLSLSLYIYISIVIHRQTCFVLSEFISVGRQYLPVAGIETSIPASNHSATRRY